MKQATHITSSARIIASKALNQFDDAQKRHKDSDVYITDVLASMINQTKQRQRATDMVMGTVRNRRAIDLVLGSVAETPAKRISPTLINVVRAGLYELVYRPETPAYSIINDAAEAVKAFSGQKQVGFVNAVLRKTASRIIDRSTAISDENIRSTLPNQNGTGCSFDRRFLPDPETQPVDYFSAAFSIPRWLIIDWSKQYGVEKTRVICAASNRRSSIYLRPNTKKTTAYGLAELFSTSDINFQITPDERMLKLNHAGNVMYLPGFEEGLFTVQDYTASAVVPAVDPQPGSMIFDLCAAPGTKTTHIAELTNDKAEIIATDISAGRLEKVEQNVERLGLSSITTIDYGDMDKFSTERGFFDIILLDVPCSNTGVMAKRPEVRLRIKPKAVENLVQTQMQILKIAAGLLKADGKLCYSTCSVLKQENQKQIAAFIAEFSNFKLLKERLTLPADGDFDYDGGYFALLRKIS